MWLVHIVLNAKTNGHRADRPKKFVNCRQKLQACKKGPRKLCSLIKKTCCKKSQVQKKEIVYPARKSVSAEIALALDTLILNPSFLPSTRAKRVHYVSVKVKLTKAKMINLKNSDKESWPRSANQAPALQKYSVYSYFLRVSVGSERLARWLGHKT